MRRMGDILDKEIGRSLGPDRRTKTQAINGVRSICCGRDVEGAPAAKTQEMVLSVMARQGICGPVAMKGARVAAYEIV